MDADGFYKKYHKRTLAYSRTFAARWGLPGHNADDLYQACWIGILKVLPDWADGSLQKPMPDKLYKNAFNWCAPAMRQEMEKVVRNLAGLKPKSTCPIVFRTDSLDFASIPSIQLDLTALIDLRRAIENDPKPKQVARFVLTAINPNEQSTVALHNKVTRQAVYMAVRRTRERLRLALG